MEISQILKEATKDILTPESLSEIQTAFESAVENKVSLNVEKALTEQDAEYTEKLKHLLEAIDADHTKKLQRVVEALDANNAAKLKVVIERYQKIIKENATSFKNELISKVSDYMDLYMEEKIPATAIEEAVKNKKAAVVLNNLRESLAIDSALMNGSLREAIVDGKTQIDESKQAVAKLQEEVSLLKESLEKANAALVLEQKTANLDEKKKEYAKRVLSDKSSQFILENIDYTIGLFEKKEQEHLSTLREEAFNNRTVVTDSITTEEEIVEEETENFNSPLVNTYMNELGRY